MPPLCAVFHPAGRNLSTFLLLAARVLSAAATIFEKTSVLGGIMFYDEEYENEGKCTVDTMEKDATATLWRWVILITIISGVLTWLN